MKGHSQTRLPKQPRPSSLSPTTRQAATKWQRLGEGLYQVQMRDETREAERDEIAAAAWQRIGFTLADNREDQGSGPSFTDEMERQIRAEVGGVFSSALPKDQQQTPEEALRLEAIVAAMTELQTLSASAAEKLNLKSKELKAKDKILRVAEKQVKELEAQVAVRATKYIYSIHKQ